MASPHLGNKSMMKTFAGFEAPFLSSFFSIALIFIVGTRTIPVCVPHLSPIAELELPRAGISVDGAQVLAHTTDTLPQVDRWIFLSFPRYPWLPFSLTLFTCGDMFKPVSSLHFAPG